VAARDLHRIAAAGGEQHPAGVARERPETIAERFGEFDRALAGEAARREAQVVKLRLDGGDDARVRVADVMDIVAVEVHVPPAVHVLDVEPLGLDDWREAGRGHRLVQEGAVVAG
jgi:hypothetical protein